MVQGKTSKGFYFNYKIQKQTHTRTPRASNKHVHYELLVVAKLEKLLKKHLSVKGQKNKLVHSYLTQEL